MSECQPILVCELWEERPRNKKCVKRTCQGSPICRKDLALFEDNVKKVKRKGTLLFCVSCAVGLTKREGVRIDAISSN